jgi:hypothetical protein
MNACAVLPHKVRIIPMERLMRITVMIVEQGALYLLWNSAAPRELGFHGE